MFSKNRSIVVVLGIFILSAWLPENWVSDLPLCLFRYGSGIDCPGCGLTRAFVAFFHGDFLKAIRFNAMAPVLILWFIIYVVDDLYTLKHHVRPQWYTPQGTFWISSSFIVLLLGQWFFKTSSHWVSLFKLI